MVPLRPEQGQVLLQDTVPGVEKIPQQVDVLAIDGGAQLDSRDHLDPQQRTLGLSLLQTAGVIVIGDADGGQPGQPGLLKKVARGESAVGVERMEMEIGFAVHATPADTSKRTELRIRDTAF